MEKRISLTQYLVEQQRKHGHIPGQLRLLLRTMPLDSGSSSPGIMRHMRSQRSRQRAFVSSIAIPS